MLEFLPTDLIKLIYSFLPLSQIMIIQLVCKSRLTEFYSNVNKKIAFIENNYSPKLLKIFHRYNCDICDLPLILEPNRHLSHRYNIYQMEEIPEKFRIPMFRTLIKKVSDHQDDVDYVEVVVLALINKDDFAFIMLEPDFNTCIYRDVNAPKRPRLAFSYFFEEMSQLLYPKSDELNMFYGQWMLMYKQERQKYDIMSENDKVRHDNELKIYMKSDSYRDNLDYCLTDLSGYRHTKCVSIDEISMIFKGTWSNRIFFNFLPNERETYLVNSYIKKYNKKVVKRVKEEIRCIRTSKAGYRKNRNFRKEQKCIDVNEYKRWKKDNPEEAEKVIELLRQICNQKYKIYLKYYSDYEKLKKLSPHSVYSLKFARNDLEDAEDTESSEESDNYSSENYSSGSD